MYQLHPTLRGPHSCSCGAYNVHVHVTLVEQNKLLVVSCPLILLAQ